jgi:AcrR family transcriptional regulator
MNSTRPPRLGRVARSEQVRAALLDAAVDEFLVHGFHGASLDQIAAAAGFTKGVVYSRFTSKADLFLALLARRIEERAAENLRLLRLVSDEGLPELARRWSAIQRRDMPWTLLVLEFRVHAARDQELNQRYAELHDRTLTGLAEVVERAAGISGPRARSLAQELFALGTGAVLEQAVDPDAMGDDAVADHVTRVVGSRA